MAQNNIEINERMKRLIRLEILMPGLRAMDLGMVDKAFTERDSAELGRVMMQALDAALNRNLFQHRRRGE